MARIAAMPSRLMVALLTIGRAPSRGGVSIGGVVTVSVGGVPSHGGAVTVSTCDPKTFLTANSLGLGSPTGQYKDRHVRSVSLGDWSV